MPTLNLLASFILLVLIPSPCLGADDEAVVELIDDPRKALEQLSPETVTELIFDASGSMKGKIQSRTKLFQAKRVLKSFMVQARNDRMNLGLRVYGQKEKDCKDSQLALPFKDVGEEAIDAALEKIDPKGYGKTPLELSLRKAGEDLAKFPNRPKRIIVVTDGLETCGGDPCKAAAELKKKHDVKIFVVAYSLNDKERKQLACLADQTGGAVFDATDTSSLANAMKELSDKGKNVFVKSPDPLGFSTAYLLLPGGKKKKVGTFVSPIGIRLEPNVAHEIVVELTPPFRFPNVVVAPNEKKTLVVKGKGEINIKFGSQLFAITLLNEAGKAVISFPSDVRTKVETGFYKIKALSPPFSEVIIDDIRVVPNGYYEEEIKGFGIVQIDVPAKYGHGPGPFGMYVFDDLTKRDIGSYFTDLPSVLPTGRYTIKSVGNAIVKNVYPESLRPMKIELPPPGQTLTLGRKEKLDQQLEPKGEAKGE